MVRRRKKKGAGKPEAPEGEVGGQDNSEEQNETQEALKPELDEGNTSSYDGRLPVELIGRCIALMWSPKSLIVGAGCTTYPCTASSGSSAVKAYADASHRPMHDHIASRIAATILHERPMEEDLQEQCMPGATLQQASGLALRGPLYRDDASFLAVFKACTGLRRLDFWEAMRSIELLTKAVPLLAESPLEELSLRGNNLGAAVIGIIAPLVARGRITRLDLEGNYLGGSVTPSAWRSWEGHLLRSVNLGANDLGNASLASLRTTLLECGLVDLDLNGCKLTELTDLRLGSNSTLKSLNLRFNPLGNAGLATLDLARNATLQQLDLSLFTNVRDLSTLALGTNYSLRELRLDNTSLDDASFRSLDLGRNTWLKKLSVSCLAKPALLCLDQNTTLEVLDMREQYSLRSFDDLHLDKNTTLRELDLSGCTGVKSYLSLGNQLAQNTTLRKLRIGRPMHDAQAEQLGLWRNRGLEDLDVSNSTSLSIKGLQAMGLGKMKALRRIDVHDSGILSEKRAKALKAVMEEAPWVEFETLCTWGCKRGEGIF